MTSNSKRLLLTHCLRQILQNFIGTFLGAYFLSVTGGNVVTVAEYYIVAYLMHIIFFYVIYKFCTKIRDIHIYRVSLVVKLIECACLLFLGKDVVNYIYLIAIAEGLSQSLYYTVYKTLIMDLADKKNYGAYFSVARAGECIISFICGIGMAEIITNFGFSVIFVILTISMVITLISSFTIKTKLKNKKVTPFSVTNFIKHTHNRHALYRILAIQFCYGLGQGGLLAVLINLVISLKSGGNQTLGYLASAVSLFAIAYSFIHRKYIDQSNFKERLLPASVILFLLAIPLALTGNILVIVAFRFLDSALTTSTVIENDNTSYALLHTITAKKYKKEYFYVREGVLNLSRMMGMELIILVIKLTGSNDYLPYLFLLGTVGYFACIVVINGLYKYYLVGPCEEARLEQLQEEVSLAEISTRCNDIEEDKKETIQALVK